MNSHENIRGGGIMNPYLSNKNKFYKIYEKLQISIDANLQQANNT